MSFSSSATVPTMIFISPSFICSMSCILFLPVNPPVIRILFTWLSFRYLSMRWKCWAARISVGAIMAACALLATANKAAYSATTVLPDPTSPCKSRFIGSGLAISATISNIELFWSSVSRKGNRFLIRLSISSLQDIGTAAEKCCLLARRRASPNCIKNSSSYFNLRFAWASFSSSGGRCIHLKASFLPISFAFLRKSVS